MLDDLHGYMAVGDADEVAGYFTALHDLTGADGIITAHQIPDLAGRLRSIEIIAKVSIQVRGAL